jgi:hypothetical protein
MSAQQFNDYAWNWASDDHTVGDRSQDQPVLVPVPSPWINPPIVGLWTGDRTTNRQLFARLLDPTSARWLQQSTAVSNTAILPRRIG